ncbi:MAG: hypothetical protein ABF338_02255, partial [Hyphomonas sp.]
MTDLATFAAMHCISCRNCKRMLRQQHGKTATSGKSAWLTFVQRAANSSFEPKLTGCSIDRESSPI